MSQDLEPSPCPVCSEPSYVFKEYKFLHLTVVFLLVVAYHSYRSQWYYSCPACMRRELWRWNKRSLLTANIIWPIMIWPTFVSRLLGTLFPWSSVGVRPWWKQTIGFLALLGAVAATVTVLIAALSFFLTFAGNQAEGFRQAALIAMPSFALCVVIAAIIWIFKQAAVSGVSPRRARRTRRWENNDEKRRFVSVNCLRALSNLPPLPSPLSPLRVLRALRGEIEDGALRHTGCGARSCQARPVRRFGTSNLWAIMMV